MRGYIRRGCLPSRTQYRNLKIEVFEKIEELDKNQMVFHDIDIQQIAMLKAKQMGLNDFKVIF